MSKRKHLLPHIAGSMVAAAALALVTQCALAEPPAAQYGAEGPSVTVVAASRSPFTETILVTGSLTARQEVLVSPQIEGMRITELLAEEGDRVAQGQVLARLDHRTLEAQLAQYTAALNRAGAAAAQAKSKITEAEAKLKQTQAAFSRAQDLVKTGTTSKATYDEREAAADTAAATLASAKDGLTLAQAEKTQVEAQIQELRLRLGFTEIKAPEAGLISRRTAKLGALASAAAEPLFRIVAKGEIELDAEIPEIYLPRVSPGMVVRVEVAGLKERQGRIRLVASEVDRATRLGKLRVFIGDDSQLRTGTFARGLISTAKTEGLGVPSTAVLHSEKGQSVQVVKDGHVATRPVRTGVISGGRTEILDGLQDGELVVLRSGTLLRDGDTVRAIEAATTTASGGE